MFPDRTILIDRHAALCDAWSESFADYENVDVVQGDFFSRDADAMISPANSFGIMDGGLDLAIRAELGFEIQAAVQQVILERHHGELPVGSAEIVATGHKRWPQLVVAPTMRIPESAAQTTNAYLAFRAILLAVRRFNQQTDATIASIVVPGLCTGIGAMNPRRCAAQMRIAFDQIAKPARIPSYSAIHEIHRALRSAG